jgi:hypothetical protein
VTIAALTGVDRSDAGVASGLLNTSRQIGGAIGIAAASALAESVTRHTTFDHGISVALWALDGLLVVGAAGVLALVRSPRPQVAPVEDFVPLEEAA